jgi:hypothetical protein
MKWEYLTVLLRNGGGDFQCSLSKEINVLGEDGWEFCAWVYEWQFSKGYGPDTREALFKRPAERAT